MILSYERHIKKTSVIIKDDELDFFEHKRH